MPSPGSDPPEILGECIFAGSTFRRMCSARPRSAPDAGLFSGARRILIELDGEGTAPPWPISSGNPFHRRETSSFRRWSLKVNRFKEAASSRAAGYIPSAQEDASCPGGEKSSSILTSPFSGRGGASFRRPGKGCRHHYPRGGPG